MSEVQDTISYRDLTVLGYPGFRVGDDGSIWSCLKRARRADGGPGTQTYQTETWHRMDPETIPAGYITVSLRVGGKRFRRLVHQLVLEAFIGPKPPKHEVAHGNGKRDDNRLSNLRWATRKENHADKYLHGTMMRGEKHTNSKVTDEQVRQIRADCAAGMFQREVAAKHGVTQTTVGRIVRRQGWTHVV